MVWRHLASVLTGGPAGGALELGLKRLASAVQLRPWPPHLKAVNLTSHSSYYRQLVLLLQHNTIQ